MRIAFLDTSGLDYDAQTPYEEPLGGSHSAVCYLAAALADLGHISYIFNGTKQNRISSGNDSIAIWSQTVAEEPGELNAFDVVVVLSLAEGRKLRDTLKVTKPLVLWNHHAIFQPAIQHLKERSEQQAWDGIAFVSGAQRLPYEELFDLPAASTVIMHNGVSPAFLTTKDRSVPQWFETGARPQLFYTSTPYRGLDVLLKAFPTIRKATGAWLRIFSSMKVYRQAEGHFQELYDQALDMEGVSYVGSVGQRKLALALRGTAALAHPSTFPECHSIAAIEAMAVGAAVYTTDLGGQRETTGGLARMIRPDTDKARLAKDFAELVIAALEEARSDPDRALAQRQERVRYVWQHYRWEERAKDWAAWLAEIGGQQRPPSTSAATRDTGHSSSV